MDIEAFIEKSRPRWQRLEALLDSAADETLGRAGLHELLVLYRATCADLNRARGLTANPELLGSINQLTGRAYRFIYRGRPAARLDARQLLLRDLPDTFQRQRRWVVASAAALILGAALGFGAALVEPDGGASLIPPQMLTQSPSRRVEQIEHGKERIDSVSKATEFGSFLYTHNIQVSFLTFALGAISFVGGLFMLFYNGVLLGAVAARYLLDGAGTFFVAWVGPHGALEIPSIVFAGAAGLLAGKALLVPGEEGRPAALRRAAPDCFRMLLGCALLLVCAGLIEGSFSQFSARAVPYAVKISFGLVLFCAMTAWLFVPRRR